MMGWEAKLTIADERSSLLCELYNKTEHLLTITLEVSDSRCKQFFGYLLGCLCSSHYRCFTDASIGVHHSSCVMHVLVSRLLVKLVDWAVDDVFAAVQCE